MVNHSNHDTHGNTTPFETKQGVGLTFSPERLITRADNPWKCYQKIDNTIVKEHVPKPLQI